MLVVPELRSPAKHYSEVHVNMWLFVFYSSGIGFFSAFGTVYAHIGHIGWMNKLTK